MAPLKPRGPCHLPILPNNFVKVHKTFDTAEHSLPNVLNSPCITANYNFANQQYVSEKKLLMSGDIELNPGPIQNTNNKGRVPSCSLLEERLRLFELRPLDVGGASDCFFRAVSHQLYGDPSHHLDIRVAGIAYMRENPERFIESNTENTWLQYLNNMSMQGTWCDGMVIQAVADQLNLRIVITETHEHFGQYSIIRAVSSMQPPTDIYLGHIDEYHYLSTLPYSSMSNLSQNDLNSSAKLDSKNVETSLDQNINNNKSKNGTTTYNLTKNAYLKEYMKRK